MLLGSQRQSALLAFSSVQVLQLLEQHASAREAAGNPSQSFSGSDLTMKDASASVRSRPIGWKEQLNPVDPSYMSIQSQPRCKSFERACSAGTQREVPVRRTSIIQSGTTQRTGEFIEQAHFGGGRRSNQLETARSPAPQLIQEGWHPRSYPRQN